MSCPGKTSALASRISNLEVLKCTLSFAAWLACMSMVLHWSAESVLAAGRVNYSGKYSSEMQKSTSASDFDLTLEVVQKEDRIEVRRGTGERRSCPLNGSEGDYRSPGGDWRKCKAQLKGKHLILESTVLIRAYPTARPVRMHTKEEWQLSANGRILTIQSEEDFPDFFPDGSRVPAGNRSGTMRYTRIEGP
jgi:hypothetical protein